jgi:hypothetical protein
MTEECAIPIPVGDPAVTISGLRQAIELLAADAGLLARLSDGARRRAATFTWRRQWEETRTIYNTCRMLYSASDADLSRETEETYVPADDSTPQAAMC